jgi:1L-myo-inositol 1-phosphate cytidylyltransferase
VTFPSTYAVILAAGFGSRLKAEEGHKLLTRVGGRSMLEHHLSNFDALGVKATVIVTGYRHEELEQAVREASSYDPHRVVFAHNPDYERSNGLSVLAAVRTIKELEGGRFAPFWLTMSDHLFEAGLFDDIAAGFDRWCADCWHGVLAVDYKLDTIFDMPDATKVAVGLRPLAIGKDLEQFDAVDAGLFWCAEGFVSALETERSVRADCSTSDAVRRLHEQGQFGFWDIGPRMWQDVDTPGARAHAESLIQMWRGRAH